MSAHQNKNGDAGTVAAQLNAAAEILEKAAGDRALLAELSEEERRPGRSIARMSMRVGAW
jgi:hypothetical protein